MTSSASLRPRSAFDSVVLLGVPLDHNSSYRRGARFAPDVVRSALASGCMNWASETGLDLETDTRWADGGNLGCAGDTADMKLIEDAAASHGKENIRLVALGGDHSITAPLLRAAHSRWEALTIVHFDAHPDLYPEYEGNRDSHASPFYRIMEEGLASRLVQVGIRTINAAQRRSIERFGVEIVAPEALDRWQGVDGTAPVYVSVDLDALDPAFAPGVSHREPGGLSVRDLLQSLRRVRAPVIGADLVEFNPQMDVGDCTAMVGAKILKELLAKVLSGL